MVRQKDRANVGSIISNAQYAAVFGLLAFPSAYGPICCLLLNDGLLRPMFRTAIKVPYDDLNIISACLFDTAVDSGESVAIAWQEPSQLEKNKLYITQADIFAAQIDLEIDKVEISL